MDVNWTHIDFLGIFWTFYVRKIYTLGPGDSVFVIRFDQV